MCEGAVGKLQEEIKNAKQPNANFVIEHLIKRIGEDEGLAEDVMQEHKTWERCWDYIVKQAKTRAQKTSGGSCAMVENETVYEWAEDYYRKDDKAEAEKEEVAKKAAEARRNAQIRKVEAKVKDSSAKKENAGKEPSEAAENESVSADSAKIEHEETILAKPVEEVKADLEKKAAPKKPKKKKDEADNQMSLFDFLGG